MLRQVGLTQGCIKHAVSGWGRLVPIFRDKTKRDELSLVLSIQIASGFELDSTLAPIQRAGFLVAT